MESAFQNAENALVELQNVILRDVKYSTYPCSRIKGAMKRLDEARQAVKEVQV
jgi:hypothetical protein